MGWLVGKEGFSALGAFGAVMTDVMAYDYFTARRYARHVVDELGLDGYEKGRLVDAGCQFGALGEALRGGR